MTMFGFMFLTSATFAQAPAQTPTDAPAANPAVEEALKKVDAGDVAPLAELADGGDTDAQYLAGVVFLFGRGTIPKDPERGCAYEEKASTRRADAMHLVGMCQQSGASGTPDKMKAEAAYTRAAEMGFIKSKCALGQMLMADPKRAARGLDLCKEGAEAGDVQAQVEVGNAYFNGTAGKRDLKAARSWYEKAAQQKNFDASRKLGQMYANGDGGPKDVKKALDLWTAAEKSGDPLVAILVADQLFSDITGGRKPGPEGTASAAASRSRTSKSSRRGTNRLRARIHVQTCRSVPITRCLSWPPSRRPPSRRAEFKICDLR
jgi:TPR repeat protein